MRKTLDRKMEPYNQKQNVETIHCVPKLVEQYNNTKHLSIKVMPIEALQEKE